MKKILKKTKKSKEATSYWISFSDLMSGTLIVFILLFIFKLIDSQETMDQKEALIKQSMQDKQQMIEEMTDTRKEIIKKLEEEFKKESMDMQIDAKTGAITLSDSILFDFGKSELKVEGRLFLRRFMPKYINTLMEDENIKANISQIIIEGHTDNEGQVDNDKSFIYNLRLSQDRAFSVSEFIISEDLNGNYKSDLKGSITANGRSYSSPVLNSDGSVNNEKSRRVEIKFRLKEEEALQKIQEELEKDKAELEY